MVCPRCGAEMSPEQRYCMKCGALNYDHPDNQDMKRYITDSELEKANQEYQESVHGSSNTIEIGGKVYVDTPEKNKRSTYVDTRVQLGLLTFVAIVLAVLCYTLFQYSVWLSLAVAFVYFIITFYLLVNISIYMKGGYSGFAPLVPFYSQYAYYDIALGNGWKFLFLFIPIFGIFYAFYVNYKLGKVFGKNGWFTLFFPFVLLPVIAFTDRAVYQGDGKKYKRYVDKGKRRNTIVPAFIYSVAIFLVFFVLLQAPFMNVVKEKFFLSDVENIFETIQSDVEDGIYTCREGNVTTKEGIYYVSFDDATKLFTLPIPVRSSLNGQPIHGYVRIENVNNKLNFYYVMTDGETVVSSDSTNISASLVKVPDGAILCEKS